MPREAMGNSHERLARAKKVAALCVVIDRFARSPSVEIEHIPQALRDQDAAWWHAMAAHARINPPSADTIAEVIAHYEARAELEAFIDDTEPMLSSARDARESDREEAEDHG